MAYTRAGSGKVQGKLEPRISHGTKNVRKYIKSGSGMTKHKASLKGLSIDKSGGNLGIRMNNDSKGI